MVVIKGGRTNYGQAIGILMLDTRFPRVPGDIGNASTFEFPVRYKTVKGASIQKVIFEGDSALLKPFITAGEELIEEAGVKAITTSCGFLAMFQKEMTEALPVPVFTSSLLQVPMVSMIIGKKRVGIITASKASLDEKHLKNVGIQGIPIAVAGMDGKKEFNKILEGFDLDIDNLEAEVVEIAKELVVKNPDLGAIVFECTNLPPFARAVQEVTKLPVFDITTLVRWIYFAIVSKRYSDQTWIS